MARRLACVYLAAFLALSGLSVILCHVVRGMPWDVWLRDDFWSAYGPAPSGGALCYGVVLAVVWVLYFRLVSLFRGSRANLLFVIAVGVGLHLLLAVATPSRSIDVFSYLAHGYNTGQNLRLAYVTPAYAVNGTPYGDALATIYRTPPPAHGATPYGPIWTYFEYFAVRMTGNRVFSGALILKFGTAAANLGSAFLIWGIFAAISPALQAGGVIAFLYNPLILGELAADGHNDAWMIFSVLLALFFAVRRKTVAASFLLCLAVLTKLVPVLLFPAFLRYVWKNARARGLKEAFGGMIAGAVVCAALFAPLWAGRNGLGGVHHLLGEGSTLARLILPAAHSPALARGLFVAALLVYLGFFLRESWRAVDESRLFEAGACLLLVCFLLFSSGVYCWHATLPVTLLLLSPRRNSRLFAYALSIAGTINSPLWSFTGRLDFPMTSRMRIQDWTGAGAMIALFLVYSFNRRDALHESAGRESRI